jgi:hypothetical protein
MSKLRCGSSSLAPTRSATLLRPGTGALRPCAGTLPLPGWFFLDKIFGGRKVKIAKHE